MMIRRSMMMATALVLTATIPAGAQLGTREVPSEIPGAPAHLLPVSAIEIAEARMREIFESRLSERLDFVEGSDADLQRLIAWADVDPDAEVSPAAAEQDLQAEASTLSPESMALLAELVSALQSGGIRIPGVGADASAGRREPIAESPGQGAGQIATASILLRGWSVAMQPTGDTYLFQDENPASGILLEPGLVIGALGAVTDIRRIGQEVHVLFASGDSMSGPAEVMATGIPQLPTIRSLAANPDMATMAVSAAVPASLHDGMTGPGTGRLVENGPQGSFALGLSPVAMIPDVMAAATQMAVPPMAAAATSEGEILLSRPAIRTSAPGLTDTPVRRIVELPVHAPGPGSLRPPINPRHARAAAAAPASSLRPPANPRLISERAAQMRSAELRP